jgi:hypothetical protein
MAGNLKIISRIFQRPVQGIHNKTYGILFDLIECTVQRTFGYPTLDIRLAYETVSALVAEAEVTKVVLFAHSQGGIESSLVLDWLFATMPPDQVAKLEVYTFGNAANHFNSPLKKDGTRVIQHIEHYGNTSEMVARCGVMFFRGVGSMLARAANGGGKAVKRSCRMRLWRAKTAADTTTMAQLRDRFVGKLFLRDAFGHMLNQHYLRNMFESEDNEFMNSPVSTSNFEGDGDAAVPEGLLKDKSRLW